MSKFVLQFVLSNTSKYLHKWNKTPMPKTVNSSADLVANEQNLRAKHRGFFLILLYSSIFFVYFFLSMETFSSKNMFLSVQNPKTYLCLLSRKKDQEKGQSHDPSIPVYKPASSSLTLVLDFTSQSRSRDLQSSSTGLQRSYACSNTFTVVPVQSSAAYSSFNRVFGSRTTALL